MIGDNQMADKGYSFEKDKLVDWSNVFSRGGAVPLERSQLFESYEDAVNYAKGNGSDKRKIGKTSYIGQIISVIENGTVSAYIINHNRELSDVSKPVVLSSQVVMSGEVRELEPSEITSEKPQGTYIILTLDNTNRDKLYIPVSSLVYTYTGDEFISVDKDNYTIVLELDKIASALVNNPIMISEFANLVNITYDELRNLKLNGKLISGQQYRITDFETTTSSFKVSVHPDARFDIVVTAVSGSELGEEARAVHHKDNTYFANSRLSEWKLKYCIDNDTSRFEWAVYGDAISQGTTYVASPKDDAMYYGTYYYAFVSATGSLVYSTKPFPGKSDRLYMYEEDYFEGWVMVDAGVFSAINRGKGVIYYMKDEFGNEAPYDFKSMKIRIGFDAEDTIIGVAPFVYYFTFNKNVDKAVVDQSLTGKCRNNVIKPLVEDGMQKINHIIFNHTDIMPESSGNFIDSDCKNMLFGGQCSNNTFGKNCQLIKLHGSNRDNVFGNQCKTATLGQGCERNKFGDKCEEMVLGLLCSDNIFDNMCHDIRFGNSSSYNTFGIRSESVYLGSYCLFNIFECYARNIKFENSEAQDGTPVFSASDYCCYNHFESGVNGLMFIFENGKFPDQNNILQNVHAIKGNYNNGKTIVSDIKFNYPCQITISPPKRITSSMEVRIDYGLEDPLPKPNTSDQEVLTSINETIQWMDTESFVSKYAPSIVLSLISKANPNNTAFFNGKIHDNIPVVEGTSVDDRAGTFKGVYFQEYYEYKNNVLISTAKRFVAQFGDKYYTSWISLCSSIYDYCNIDDNTNELTILSTKAFYNTQDGYIYRWTGNDLINL